LSIRKVSQKAACLRSREKIADQPLTLAVLNGVHVLIVAMLLRFGLLSLVVAIFVTDMMSAFAFTPNFSAWYGTASLTATLLIAGLAVVAFRNALGGQKILGRFLDE
jgi:hypothetical protein